MSIKERCPNDIFLMSTLGGLLKAKPLPSSDSLMQVLGDLPLIRGNNGLLEVGDWGHGRSSEGSAILNWGKDNVVKVPVGKYRRDPLLQAREKRDTIQSLRSVSPPTQVFLARVQGEIKPITIQRKIKGKPACKAPLADLLKLQTLTDLSQILKEKKKLFLEKELYDLCGQRFKTRLCFLVLGFSPFFSDNIMVENGGSAYLVDNVPDGAPQLLKGRSRLKKFFIFAKFTASGLSVSSLIILRKTWDGLSRLEKHSSPEKSSGLALEA